ncbi:MAG: serine/threonine-protein kinase, partial [Kiritimatiellia bacterium]
MTEWNLGQTILDDYVVDRVLGKGGMGIVYLVHSRTNGRQFAVKRATGLKESDRRNFLAELQTWIDLPEHPNIVPCRFFRTVGDEVLIFAEYVEGGSLKDWIDSKKLYEGGPQEALERILDISIQFAWGLHCMHELGVVHQDVKPGNVLMSFDGAVAMQGVRPRVTDFGLARARAAGGEHFVPALGRSILVSSGGYTPAYCSPEQAERRPVTRQTDIWSWGVSVLEMFTGEVAWISGQVAAEVLEQYLQSGEPAEKIPAMPIDLAELLRQCFLHQSAERPVDLAWVVENLKAAYRREAGAAYDRKLNTSAQATPFVVGIEERRRYSGAGWTDPQVWLEKGLRAAGRDPAEAGAMLSRRGVTRRGELVAEMSVYDEAKRLYQQLVRDGRKELESDLAELCSDKALIHRAAADEHGTLGEYDQAIAILERLVNQEGRNELLNNLATVYMNKASAVRVLGDNRRAAALCNQAITIWEQLVNQEGRSELADALVQVYINKANAVSALGDNRGAIELYDQSITILERLVNLEGRRELEEDLAAVYMNKAIVVSTLGDNRGAMALYDLAIAIRERLVNQEDRFELADDLAKAYTNKANAASNLGDNRGAMALYDQAIAIWERLVNLEGRSELVNRLATVYTSKAIVVSDLGDHHGAMTLYDQAIGIWERLVNKEGCGELAGDLARAYMNKAVAVSTLGDNRRTVALCDQAIAILERLVNQESRRELADLLAKAYTNKAAAVSILGDNRGAVVLYDKSITILEQLINREGRSELANLLATVCFNKGTAVSTLGDNRGSVALYDQAITLQTRKMLCDVCNAPTTPDEG